MKKITFLMLHFGYGGVESAIANQANMLCEDFDVKIVSIYKLNYDSPHKLNKNVKLEYLSDLRPNREEIYEAIKTKNIIKLFKESIKAMKILYLKKQLIKNYIKKSDSEIIVSTRVSFNKLLGKYAKKDVIKIAQEHVYHNNDYKYINKVLKSIENIDYFMPVSSYLTNFYKNKIKSKTKCKYIRHALDFEIEKYDYKITKNLIAVGRLSEEKGFLDLLDVIYNIKKDIPNIKLNLLGDGPDKNKIKEKIKVLNLNDNVELHGFKTRNEINKIIKDCSLYCMTSYEESFGLTVIESLAFGLPCIAFDSAKGVLEIIDNNTGIIITDRNKQQMANEIINLFKDKKRLKTMSKNSYNESFKYSVENIKKEWIKFYKEINK